MQRAIFHLPGLSGDETGGAGEWFNASLAVRALLLRTLLLAALGLLCTAAAVRAESPVLTLAMVDYDSLASRPAARDNFVAKAAPPVSSEESSFLSMWSLLLDEMALPTTTFLQRAPQPAPANPLLLSLRNVGEDGHPRVWGSFTAGYGQIFLYKTVAIYGRNGSCWQEPGFGFLKFTVNF